MTDGFTVDDSDFYRLEADLGAFPREAAGDVRAAVEVNAHNIRDSWRDKLSGSETAPRAQYSIDYDISSAVTFLGSSIEAEIGARKYTGKQGGVALLWEFGAPRRGLAPRGYGAAALQENADDLERGLQKALDSALRGVNL